MAEQKPAVDKASGQEEPWVNVLSFRGYAISLAAVFLLIVAALWIYERQMKIFSEYHIDLGDRFRDRAMALKASGRAEEFLKTTQKLDDLVNKVYPIVAKYEQYSVVGGYEPDSPLNKAFSDAVASSREEIKALSIVALNVAREAHLAESFAEVISRLDSRAQDVAIRMEQVAGKPANIENSEGYLLLCNVELPSLISQVKRVRDLFDHEACFDRAMQEYFEAGNLSRLWSEPWLRMADLYRDRGWTEVAMTTYLRVMKLDPSGPDGARAFEELRKFDGKHAEADFGIGLALLLRGEYEGGRNILQRFLDRSPGNIRAPQADALVKNLDQKNLLFVKRFLRDEIWI